jgi:O-antigen ligase
MKKASFNTTQWLLLVSMLMMAALVGMALPVVIGWIGDRYARLAALPVLFVMALLFVFNRRLMFLLIIFLRASGDIVLESTKGAGGPGLGGAINAFIILIAFLFFIEHPRRVPKEVMLPWIVLLGVYAIGVALAPDKGAAVRAALGVCSYFAVFVCAFHVVRSPEDFRAMVRLVVLSSILPALYGVLSFALQARSMGISAVRLQSTFSHPNIFAFYITLVVSMGLYMLKSPHYQLSSFRRFALTGYLLFMLVLLLLTQTRSAWIACFFLFFLYGALFERRYLIYLAVLPFLALLIPSVQDRILQLDSGNGGYAYAKLNSFAWRVVLWKSSLNWMGMSRYLTGYGVESFPFYSQTFFSMAGNIKWDAHSVYVQTFFELGAMGIAAFLFLFYKVGRALYRLLPQDRLACLLLLCLLVEYLIVSASDNLMFYLAFNWYFWLLAGMGCSLYFSSEAHQLSQARRQPPRSAPANRKRTLRPV